MDQFVVAAAAALFVLYLTCRRRRVDVSYFMRFLFSLPMLGLYATVISLHDY